MMQALKVFTPVVMHKGTMLFRLTTLGFEWVNGTALDVGEYLELSGEHATERQASHLLRMDYDTAYRTYQHADKPPRMGLLKSLAEKVIPLLEGDKVEQVLIKGSKSGWAELDPQDKHVQALLRAKGLK